MSPHPRNLPQLLSEAKRWFDEALQASMQAAGERPVSTAQTAVFATLDPEGTTVSELARRIGVTRQTAHQAVHGLIAMGLLEQVPDPSSARSRLIRTTAEGERVHQRAQASIALIEGVLAARVGRLGETALRETLTLDWGAPPLVSAP
ncbi:MarR family winged helix-turn-helix transcriptional regulator [uncultured Streptomyces sp.]|uniref:MarR family winged helix-turn-helix transcriptional regulator n=1 Tax=uncultured Streptomyces sp. TaxID=174707 RepID=UPI0026036B0D|nr:MarR family winged helix-turn-helix transcriptional regulator [uncultured Streptomyces sp.]